MDAESVGYFFQTIHQSVAVRGIPKCLNKNSHIPRLRLETIMPESGNSPKYGKVRQNEQPNYFSGSIYHKFILLL